MMHAPHFWQHKGWISFFLLPFSVLYDIVSTLRRAMATPVRLPVPIICVGNLTAGGSGKTPVALHIGALLKEKGINAYYISRGYGGTLSGPVRVNSAAHSAREVGDEPLLLARVLPTIIAKDRLAAAQLAIAEGAEMLVMDDGFQNARLIKDISLLVIDGSVGLGNGRLLPAGPLRERAATGFKRSSAVILINPHHQRPSIPAATPVLTARVIPQILSLKNKKLVAFCGIAYPHKFFDTLRELGGQLVHSLSFGDHHYYKEHELKKLRALAEQEGATLITTAKDATRLTPEWRDYVSICDIALAFDKPAMLEQLIDVARRTHI